MKLHPFRVHVICIGVFLWVAIFFPIIGWAMEPDPYEPDDHIGHASTIVPNDNALQKRTFHSVQDTDWVKFSGVQDTFYLFEIDGLPPNCSVAMTLHHQDGSEIPTIYNQDNLKNRAQLVWKSNGSGTFFIRIAQQTSCLAAIYLLGLQTINPIGNETNSSSDQADEVFTDDVFQRNWEFFDVPSDEIWFRFASLAGNTYAIELNPAVQNMRLIIELYDQDRTTLLTSKAVEGTGLNNRIDWYSAQNQLYYLRIRPVELETHGIDTLFDLRIKRCLPDAYEINSPEKAGIIVPDATVSQSHNFYEPGDQNWVKFYALSGQSYTIDAKNTGKRADLILEVYDSDGNLIQSKDSAENPIADEQIILDPSKDEIYYIRVKNSNLDEEGDAMDYELQVTRSVSPTVSGFIEGYVINSYNQSPISGAKIKTGASVTALSFENGSYLMVHAPGNYSISAEADGYEIYSDVVNVLEGGTTLKDISMIPKTGTVPSPVFQPLPGRYEEPINIEISCNESGSAIYYTMDGNEPTAASSPYSEPIQITGTTRIKAKAFKTDMAPSETVEAVYTFSDSVETPEFSHLSDIYTAPIELQISCATGGANIYYTTDGTPPEKTSSRYDSPILISETTTVKAKAYKDNWGSEIATANYIISAGENSDSGGGGGCFMDAVLGKGGHER